MFYDGDWVEAYDANFAMPWKGQIAHNTDGELIVVKENGDYRYFYNLAKIKRAAAPRKDYDYGLREAEEEFKNYNDYLSYQIHSNMEKGVDYTKANDLQKKELAKNYAAVAASQKNKMENTPKNDKEAEDSFNGVLANELLSQNSEKAATAQKNIDEISSKIQEQIIGEQIMRNLHEAQASMAYYGFKRVPRRDFSDDGTTFFMWVWDPEDTGHSPFYFSKAGGYGMIFFSEQFSPNIRRECHNHGYNDLDDLNGISKDAFTDEALGKIVAQLQEIRQSDWFESVCPEFSTRGAIETGIEVKDYNADKDHQRVMDIAKRAKADPEKMAKLAANMAKAIGDKEKMRSRWQAAIDVYGEDSPVAKAFEAQVKERGWHITIRPRSSDIDWSSLFENVNDESIYKAHAEFKKYQEKKKKEDDNQENFTFDEGSVKLATVVKESEERKYRNNFFGKLMESVYENRTKDLLKNYFDTTDVEHSDETCWGLPVYIVNNMRYAVGDADEAYEAAVKQAISIYDDETEEGKINWLQRHHWPGVDEEGVCEACGDDPDDYDEDETIYKPSSIDEYIETMGFSQASDAFSIKFLENYINKREIGEYIVDNDGTEALASEDGNEISIGDDLYAYCLGQ